MHTVSRALRRLVLDGHLSRRGHTWITGKRADPSTLSFHTAPVIVAIEAIEGKWRTIHTNAALMPFGTQFTYEADRHGVRIVPTVLDEQYQAQPLIPCGRQRIMQVLGELEGRKRTKHRRFRSPEQRQ